MNFHIDFAAMLKTLPAMLFGMLGIFIVMIAIYAIIWLMGKAPAKAENGQD